MDPLQVTAIDTDWEEGTITVSLSRDLTESELARLRDQLPDMLPRLCEEPGEAWPGSEG